MGFKYDDAGFTRATLGARQTIKKFLFPGSLAFFLRYAGFFLLGLVIYLHFFFHSLNPNRNAIEAWIVCYLSYQIVLQYLRRFRFYNASRFVLVRIVSNFLLISWLLYAAPLMRGHAGCPSLFHPVGDSA